MTEWTPARVEERLRKAVAVQVELSGKAGELSAEHTAAAGKGTIGGIGADADPGSCGDFVAGAAEALSWLRWLEPTDAGIVLARLESAPWKAICFRFGVSRPTADRRYRYALALIAWHLNGHACSERTPSLRALLGMPLVWPRV